MQIYRKVMKNLNEFEMKDITLKRRMTLLKM